MPRTLALSALVVLSMTVVSAQTDYLARARALHKTSLLIDGHNDYPWALREEDPARDLDKLDILGADVADLIATIDHNLQRSGSDPRFQRKVMYDNVAQESVAEFRAMSAAQAQALLEAMDKWLSQRDLDVNPSRTGTGRMRAGIGIYYFEENLEQRSKDN